MSASLDQLEKQLAVSLAAWGGASVVAGTALWLSGGRRTSFGRQTAAWGAIDLAIAAVAHRRAGGGRSGATADDRRRRLQRTLVFNSALDVGYIAGGLVLVNRADSVAAKVAGRRPYSAEQVRGDGAAIVVQGAFLLILDTAFAVRTRRHARQ